ncbi:hypothetical protein L1887_05552 [Cichorium endivia]|nr:hypothetical protein L1887_05552 [Cichorium endivia]
MSTMSTESYSVFHNPWTLLTPNRQQSLGLPKSKEVFHYFLVFEFDINCRCGLVAWQLRLFLTATFLVDSFLHCCGPLQNTSTEKRVEGSSSSIIINKTRTFVWFLSFPGKDLRTPMVKVVVTPPPLNSSSIGFFLGSATEKKRSRFDSTQPNDTSNMLFGLYLIDLQSTNFTSDIIQNQVFWDYSATKVLTLEYVPGIKISNLDLIKERGYSRSRISSHAIEAYLIQILKTGFFHPDPHPGNLAIDSDESVIYYDFGMMGEIKSFTRERLMDLLYAVYEKDAKKVMNSLISLEALQPTRDMSSEMILGIFKRYVSIIGPAKMIRKRNGNGLC